MALCFVISRCIYYWMGVRFEVAPLTFYWQMIDPVLLRDELWRSLFYLRSQLPGFNLYIGSTMHVAPRHFLTVFHATYLLLGLTLGICLFLLLDRLRLSRPVAFVIAVVCMINPVTVLYENRLFYEYPIAVLFCISALFLHRYAARKNCIDGVALFTALACIALLRVIYHLLWFWMIVALLIYFLPKCRRRTALCAVAPGALIALVYLKSIVLFGLWAPGSDIHGSISLAYMAAYSMTPDDLRGLADQGAISPIILSVPKFEDPKLLQVVPIPPRTGIRILDERLKSTGAINMDSLWMAAVGQQLQRDGLVLVRSHPKAVLTTLRRNVIRSFLPADLGWPFDQTQPPNLQVLAPLLTAYDLAVFGKHPARNYVFVSWFAIPCLLWFGLRRTVRLLKRASRYPYARPRDLTIAFCFGNIAYLGTVVVLSVYVDQNRYLFEVFPLFAILLGALLVYAAWRLPVWQARIRL
jgi:hypothetical protein